MNIGLLNSAIGWVIGKDYYNNNLKETVKGIFRKEK